MKTPIYIAALLIATPLLAYSQAPDTIMMKNPEHVVITESPEGMKAIITDNQDDKLIVNQEYMPNSTVISRISTGGFSLRGRDRVERSLSRQNRKGKPVTWDVTSGGGLGIGFCSAPGAPSGSNIEQAKSFELSWLNILAISLRCPHNNSLTASVGINWRNYRTTQDACFTVNDGTAGIGNYPDGATPRLSRIKIFSVQFPVLWRQSMPIKIFGEQISTVFGPIVNLNAHGSVLSSWYEDSKSMKHTVNGINLRLFTVDLFAMIHLWDCGGVYVRYSPYKMMTGSQRFNFHPFSTGIMFLM